MDELVLQIHTIKIVYCFLDKKQNHLWDIIYYDIQSVLNGKKLIFIKEKINEKDKCYQGKTLNNEKLLHWINN